MGEIKSVMGFILPCRLCGSGVFVGPTKEFIEKGSGSRTAYYDPSTSKLVGISLGTGASFECIACHAVKWAANKHIHSDLSGAPPLPGR